MWVVDWGLGVRVRRLAGTGLRNSEISELEPAVVEQDVGQLYVAVDDGFVVEVAGGGGSGKCMRQQSRHTKTKQNKKQ